MAQNYAFYAVVRPADAAGVYDQWWRAQKARGDHGYVRGFHDLTSARRFVALETGRMDHQIPVITRPAPRAQRKQLSLF